MNDTPTRSQHGGPVCAHDPYPHIPPGRYDALVTKEETYYDKQYMRKCSCLRMAILAEGVELLHYLNLGDGKHPEVRRRSKYFSAWVIARGSMPRRGQEMSPAEFLHKIFLVEVADVTKDADRYPHPNAAVYSTVKRIIEKRSPE